MIDRGTRVLMTKGYRGVSGVVTGRTGSDFDFYVIKLDNGINIVVGPSAFEIKEDEGVDNT